MARKKQTEQEKKARALFLKNEAKDTKFKRIANPRITRIIHNLRAVAKMGNSSQYTITEAEVEKLEQTLTNEVENVITSLQSKSKETETIKDVL